MIKSNYTKRLIRLLISSFALCGVLMFVACESKKKDVAPIPDEKDEGKEKPLFEQTIGEYLSKRNEFSLLVSQLERFKLLDGLNDTSAAKITLFAPNDGAINAFVSRKGFASTAELLAALDAGKLKYHILNGLVESSQITKGKINSSTGQVIYTHLGANGLYLNGSSRVVSADIKLKNGIIHIVNEMIEPIEPKTILQELKDRGNFKNFLALLQELGLDSLLNEPSITGYTVFAPNDVAFAKSASYLNSLSSNKLRDDVIRYHILNETKFTFEFRDNKVQTLHQRNKSVILRDGAPSRVDDVVLRGDSIDIFTTNGVIHILPEVLRPATTVADILFYAPNYSDMYEALNRSGLLQEIDNSNFVTLFALNNQQVAEGTTALGYPGGINDPFLRQDTLLNVLRYHTILGSRVGTGSFSNKYFQMSNGAYIYTTRNGNNIDITDASRVGTAKIVSSESAVNGVVHFIDRGLEPPRKTIYDVVHGSPNHTILDSIITYSEELGRATNLKTILSNRENRFLFPVPSDASFRTLFGLLKVGRNSLSSVDSAVWYTQNKGTKELDTLIDIVRGMLLPASPVLIENLPDGVNKIRSLQGYEVTLNNRILQGNRVTEIQGELVGPAFRRSGGRLVLTVPQGTNWQTLNGIMMPFQNEAIPVTIYPFWR